MRFCSSSARLRHLWHMSVSEVVEVVELGVVRSLRSLPSSMDPVGPKTGRCSSADAPVLGLLVFASGVEESWSKFHMDFC
jgi:hypothetical protein